MSARTNIKKTYGFLLSLVYILFFLLKSAGAQYNTSLGITLGYSGLNMEEVNDDLNQTYDMAREEKLSIFAPEEISGAILWGGQVLFRASDHLIGVSFNQLSTGGSILGSDATGKLEEKYDVGTSEFLAIVGYTVPVGITTSLSFRICGGLGIAYTDYHGVLDIYGSTERDIDVTVNASGNYFAGRLQAGVEIVVEKAIINFSLAYRLANAGPISGPTTINGEDDGEGGIKDSYGSLVEIDFSGLMFGLCIDFVLWDDM